MLYEVQFKKLVVVDRIGKLLLPSFCDVKYILAHQRANLMKNPELHTEKDF
jgi:hypothetical protein